MKGVEIRSKYTENAWPWVLEAGDWVKTWYKVLEAGY